MKMLQLKFSNTSFYILLISTTYILIYNIFHYSPILGYDAEAHFEYVNFLAMYLPEKLVLPSAQDTREFFSPPIAYLFPATAQVICRNLINSSNYLVDCEPIYSKATQIFQSILYIGTLFINLYTLKLFNRSEKLINTGYLILVSLLAVNYRTFSMIRGEPYILFFMSLFLLLLYKAELKGFKVDLKYTFSFGVLIAFLALSRQWAFLLFFPIIILAITPKLKFRYRHFKFWLISSLIGALGSSWFYLSLFFNYGSFTSFNQSRTTFSFKNQPLDFYLPTLEQLTYLFSKPIRPYLDGHFLSILYADLWGDYWGYFTFTSRFLDVGRNQAYIGDYLARVNIASLITTLIILIFCLLTYKHFKESYFIKYMTISIFISIFGYLIFAISYIEDGSDTIKASYIIQLFNLLVFLASVYFHKLRTLNKKVYNIVLTFLIIIYIHNFQTYLSHFPINFYP
jgi:hypothetical protein